MKGQFLMYSLFEATIAAVSTPRGKGGIAVIRISGGDALPICEKFIRPKSGTPLSEIKANTACLAAVSAADGSLLDEAVITVYRAPKSYTGEDTVEISCHGGILLTEAVLARALECGAVPAGPGEFTRRAFSAGKLSLSEAEAVIGMIDAETRASLLLSRKNLDGGIRRKTDELYDRLKAVVSGVYAAVDFPDEDLLQMSTEEIRSELSSVVSALEGLRDSYKTGHAVCEGIRTVLAGKPNTGKSTILNLLAGKERAIVTDIAGTTRDVVSEVVTAGAVMLRLSDTAGIRSTSDAVESIGVAKSKEALAQAELILAVFDTAAPLDEEDAEVLALIRERAAQGAAVIAILNKSDLPEKSDAARLEKELGTVPVRLCAKEEQSRGTLVKIIENMFVNGDLGAEDHTVITNARQFAAVSEALAHVGDAAAALDSFGADIACTELEAAMARLGELDGRQVTADVVDSIFHRFCVGK